MFKKSDLEGIIKLIKETKKNGGGFKEFVQGFKEFGNISIKSSDIIEFTEDLNDNIKDFNNRNNIEKFNLDTFLNGIDNVAIADKFKAIAESSDNATASIKDMFAVVINGNTHGFKNVTGLINDFNKLDPNNQKAFASAIGQTNQRLNGYLTSLGTAKASMGGYIKYLATAKLATIGLQAATMALNMALNAGIMLAINAIIAAINSYQNSIDKIKELSESIKSLEDNVKSLDSELKENLNKLRDLEKIKAPSLYEQDQIDNLKEANEELERRIKLKKYELKLQQIDIDKEVKDLWRKVTFTDVNGINMFGVKTPEIMPSLFKTKQHDLDAYLKKYEEFQKFKDDYDTGKLNINPVEFENKSKEFGETLKSYEGRLMSFRNDMELIMLGIDPDNPNNKFAIEQATNFVNTFDEIFSKVNDDNYGTFTGVYESAEFSGVVEELNALAKAGELTEETFNNVKGIEAFKSALNEIGITDAADIIKAIETAVGKTAKTTEKDGVPAVESLTEEYQNLADAIDKVISKQNKLTEIYKKIMTGGSFSRDEVLGYLKEFPGLIDSVMMNEDGTFTFKLDNVKVEMDKSNDDLESQIQAKIDKATKGVNISIEDYFESDAGYNNAFTMASSGFRSQDDADYFNKKYFAEHKDEYDKYIQDQEKSLNGLSNVLGMVDDNLISQAENLKLLDERCKNYVDEITKLNAPIKTVQEAINAMNEGQALTYDQMVELLQISPELSDSVTKQGDGYYIVVDSLINLREESCKTRNEYIDNLIAMEKASIEAAEAEQNMIAAKINSYASSLIYMKEIAEIESEIASKEGIIAILEQMKNGLVNPDGGGGGSGSGGISDILQQQIDRYEVLLNAIEIVSNKRIELLEAEKKALQDKNDEEQRELDLIEAKNNLDKAKKMKTIVYEKGKGFVQVENKKAISDAQKEYDDAVLEKRTAEIDKQIESLENYAKPFSEMKSDIEDAITVEKAKKALKTDENGLLSLDEKTAKNIRDGLAGAVLKKDKKDNSDNPYYQNVTLDDLLKSLGATVTGEQAKAIFAQQFKNMQLPQTNMQAFNNNTTNNSYVNTSSSSNRNITINPVFNIYDASDPVKIRNEIDGYFRDIAREIK